jgi:uncharacterized protein GlcG (DUF336 family)
MFMACGALAQTPTSASVQAQPLPLAPPYGTPITLSQARKAASIVEAEAARLGNKRVVIAVVDPSGLLVLFEKMDEATNVSVQFAIAKARTAAIGRRETSMAFGLDTPLPDLISLPGGVPIVVGDRTIGAIGVSGVESGGDRMLGNAAAAAMSKP